jgi:hypothetical protein
MVTGATANVLDYGADPTGVADSSAAFALAVATGKSVFVPKGTYKASFDLGDRQALFGEGGRSVSIIIPNATDEFCVRIDARTSSKLKCQIRDIGFDNPNSVADRVAIQFRGTDVNSINDQHIVSNVYITGFTEGIQVTGRQILCSYYNVSVETATRAFTAACDPLTPAFNGNTFYTCRFSSCTIEGVNITGQNATNAFYSCNFEICNTADAAGVAAVYVEDSEQMQFIGCYWEDNGGGVAVDNVTLSNNSVGVKFAGTYCYNPLIESAFFVGSGILLWLATATRGGEIANCRLSPLTGGYSLYVSAALAGHDQFIYDASNFNPNGLIEVVQDGNGNYGGKVRQASSCLYMTTTQTIDLIGVNKLVVNPNGTTFTGISAINNRIPGQELWVWNESGANTFTIDAGLIYRGSGVIAAQAGRRYIVGGFPADGKLIEM